MKGGGGGWTRFKRKAQPASGWKNRRQFFPLAERTLAVRLNKRILWMLWNTWPATLRLTAGSIHIGLYRGRASLKQAASRLKRSVPGC